MCFLFFWILCLDILNLKVFVGREVCDSSCLKCFVKFDVSNCFLERLIDILGREIFFCIVIFKLNVISFSVWNLIVLIRFVFLVILINFVVWVIFCLLFVICNNVFIFIIVLLVILYWGWYIKLNWCFCNVFFNCVLIWIWVCVFFIIWVVKYWYWFCFSDFVWYMVLLVWCNSMFDVILLLG